jgi:hypothetical protein
LRQCRARISKDWKMIDWLRNLAQTIQILVTLGRVGH